MYASKGLNESRDEDDEEMSVTLPPLNSLTTSQLDRHGAYIMDCGTIIYLYLGPAISDSFCSNLLDVPSYSSAPEGLVSEGGGCVLWFG